jgi:hemerythrin-like domain-containing protein
MRTAGSSRSSRRGFLSAGAAGALLIGCHAAGAPRSDQRDEPGDDEVTPAEDLMREHGVLRRVLFVFDEAAHRLDTGAALPLDALAAGAGIIRHVIEDYHEKIEEQHLFPRFERAATMTALVAILRRQHEAGRAVTARILALTGARLADADRVQLALALRSFNRMYRPHAAREDTVLFPALRGLVGAAAYRELGEQFEDIEHRTLGEGGFERAVASVARIEQAFGLDDLASFTP